MKIKWIVRLANYYAPHNKIVRRLNKLATYASKQGYTVIPEQLRQFAREIEE